MTTQESNKLIAEFMYPNKDEEIASGEVDISDGVFQKACYYFGHYDEMRYHTSWDWLMPVGKKCIEETLKYKNLKYYGSILNAVQTFNVDLLYKAVVEFIKWWNDGNRESK